MPKFDYDGSQYFLIQKSAFEKVRTSSDEKCLDDLNNSLINYRRVVEQTHAGRWSDYRNETRRDMFRMRDAWIILKRFQRHLM